MHETERKEILRNHLHIPLTVVAIALPGVFALGPSGARASCNTASCPIDLSTVETGGHQAQVEHGLSLHFTYESIEQDQPCYGSNAVQFQHIRRTDHDEIETSNRNVNARALYTLSPQWSFSLTVPVVRRSHSHILGSGHLHDEGDHAEDHDDDGLDGLAEVGFESWDFTELGDVAIRGRYQSVRPESAGSDWSVSGGLGLPTGATDLRNDAGALAEPSLQPGTGGWSLLLNAGYRNHVRLPLLNGGRQDGGAPSMWTISSSLRLNTRGEADYRYGDEWLTHAGLHHSVNSSVDLLGQFVVRWRGHDDVGDTGEPIDATGGTSIYLSPGLNLKLAQGLSAYGYYQLPIFQDVNEVQLTSDSNLVFGLGYRLSL